MVRKSDVILGKNHRLVHNKETKDQPKLQRDQEKFLHLFNAFLLQSSTYSLHVIFLPAISASVVQPPPFRREQKRRRKLR